MSSITGSAPIALLRRAESRLVRLEDSIHRRLVAHSITALRVATGLIFLVFGLLKFFPGVSPAQSLATMTFAKLSFGLIDPSVSIILVASLETVIGICLLSGRGMRMAIWLLVFQLIGILSPLVFFWSDLFAGPGGAPTLTGQYVLKDIILVAAAMVIAAGTFRSGRLVRDEPQPILDGADDPADYDARRKLEVVLQAADPAVEVDDVCEQCGISQATFYRWRDAAFDGAGEALEEDRMPPPPRID